MSRPRSVLRKPVPALPASLAATLAAERALFAQGQSALARMETSWGSVQQLGEPGIAPQAHAA